MCLWVLNIGKYVLRMFPGGSRGHVSVIMVCPVPVNILSFIVNVMSMILRPASRKQKAKEQKGKQCQAEEPETEHLTVS